MADEKSLADRAAQWRQDNQGRQPAKGAEFDAVFREAVKDVRDTFNQVFFNQKEGPGEPGTPLNPTMQEVTSDRGILGDYNQRLDIHASREAGKSEDRSLGH